MPKEASYFTQAWEKHGPLASRHLRSAQPSEKVELRWPRPPSFPWGLDGGVTWLPDSPPGHQRPQPNPSSVQSSDTWRPRTGSPPARDSRRPAPRPGFGPGLGTGSRLPGAGARRGHRRGARPQGFLREPRRRREALGRQPRAPRRQRHQRPRRSQALSFSSLGQLDFRS